MGGKRIYIKFIHVLARIVGVLWILGAVFFAVSAFVVASSRIVYSLVGVFLLVIGIAFLRAKPIRKEDLARIRSKGVGTKESR